MRPTDYPHCMLDPAPVAPTPEPMLHMGPFLASLGSAQPVMHAIPILAALGSVPHMLLSRICIACGSHSRTCTACDTCTHLMLHRFQVSLSGYHMQLGFWSRCHMQHRFQSRQNECHVQCGSWTSQSRSVCGAHPGLARAGPACSTGQMLPL